MQNLVDSDEEGSQAHVYGGWPEAGVEDEGKKKLADQVRLAMLSELSPTVALDSRLPHLTFVFPSTAG